MNKLAYWYLLMQNKLQSPRSREGAVSMEYLVIGVIAVVVGLVVIRAFWGDYDQGTGIGGVLSRLITRLNAQFGGTP